MASHNINSSAKRTRIDSSTHAVAIRSAARINSGFMQKLTDAINKFGEWSSSEDGQRVQTEFVDLFNKLAGVGAEAAPPKTRNGKIEKVIKTPDGKVFRVFTIPYDDSTSDIVINLNRFNDVPNSQIEETIFGYIDEHAELDGTVKENKSNEIVYTPGSRKSESKSDKADKPQYTQEELTEMLKSGKAKVASSARTSKPRTRVMASATKVVSTGEIQDRPKTNTGVAGVWELLGDGKTLKGNVLAENNSGVIVCREKFELAFSAFYSRGRFTLSVNEDGRTYFPYRIEVALRSTVKYHIDGILEDNDMLNAKKLDSGVTATGVVVCNNGQVLFEINSIIAKE